MSDNATADAGGKTSILLVALDRLEQNSRSEAPLAKMLRDEVWPLWAGRVLRGRKVG